MRAVRKLLATGAIAGLADLAACTDERSKSLTAPGSTRSATTSSGTQGHGSGFAATIRVCVDASSPAGTYKFRNSSWNSGLAIPPSGFLVGGTYYDQGDGGEGLAPHDGSRVFSPAKGDNSEYTVAVGSCVTVLDRTEPSLHYGSPDPDHGFSQADNQDDWQAVNVSVSTIPAGAVYDHTDCTIDVGTINPQPNPCGTSSQTVRGFANFDHGTQITYFFTEAEETPCPAGSFSASLNGNGDLVMIYDQFPAPNDNSYGVNAVGWDGGHTFGNLTGSDKAGFQIRNAAGTVVLSFNVDYLSAKSGTNSGYASLGPFGGDGDLVVGTLTPADIEYTTSLAQNLNDKGFCTAGNCSGLGTNLLVNSPPTINNTSYTLPAGSPYGAWNFHNTYFVTIKAAKLATLGLTGTLNQPGGWSATPNATVLHNSPAKPCPPGPFPCSDITVGAKTLGSKEVKVDVNNVNQTTDAFVTGVHITWPVGTNGALKSIKVGGDVIWSGTNSSGNVNFTLADLVADAAKRKIAKKSDEDIKFTFANNVVVSAASYAASLDFGDDCNKPILP